MVTALDPPGRRRDRLPSHRTGIRPQAGRGAHTGIRCLGAWHQPLEVLGQQSWSNSPPKQGSPDTGLDEGEQGTCHSPAPQSSPVFPATHWHCPVTGWHGAPTQAQMPEQFWPKVPAGHSVEGAGTVGSPRGVAQSGVSCPHFLRAPATGPAPQGPLSTKGSGWVRQGRQGGGLQDPQGPAAPLRVRSFTWVPVQPLPLLCGSGGLESPRHLRDTQQEQQPAAGWLLQGLPQLLLEACHTALPCGWGGRDTQGRMPWPLHGQVAQVPPQTPACSVYMRGCLPPIPRASSSACAPR